MKRNIQEETEYVVKYRSVKSKTTILNKLEREILF
jgi:hypothetical protein